MSTRCFWSAFTIFFFFFFFSKVPNMARENMVEMAIIQLTPHVFKLIGLNNRKSLPFFSILIIIINLKENSQSENYTSLSKGRKNPELWYSRWERWLFFRNYISRGKKVGAEVHKIKHWVNRKLFFLSVVVEIHAIPGLTLFYFWQPSWKFKN